MGREDVFMIDEQVQIYQEMAEAYLRSYLVIHLDGLKKITRKIRVKKASSSAENETNTGTY
jgi:hypothetical protein